MILKDLVVSRVCCTTWGTRPNWLYSRYFIYACGWFLINFIYMHSYCRRLPTALVPVYVHRRGIY